MPASTEFVDLCHAQMALMGEALDADSIAIYLADNWHENSSLPDLVPIAAYPHSGKASTVRETSLLDIPVSPPIQVARQFPAGNSSRGETPSAATLQVFAPADGNRLPPMNAASANAEEQLIIPLMHESTIIGVLTSHRIGQPWQELERQQWERLAQTLTLACVLDQRGQWLKNRLQHSRDTQIQQSQRFHELLHQIRSPLTALKTFGKLLLKRLNPDSNHASLTQNMLREGDRIQDLLQYFDSALQATDHHLAASSDSLPLLLPAAESTSTNPVLPTQVKADLESLTHFGGHLQIKNCDLSTVLAPILESAQVLSQNQQLAFAVEPVRDRVIVAADPRAIVEIANTLLENAFKYSGEQTLIWVQTGFISTHSHKSFCGILIGDTGPGIPLEDQPYIFERHYRGTQAQGCIPGTGLGLAIVQDLVHAMDGYIEVFSPLKTSPVKLIHKIKLESLHRGTAFIVWLPTALNNEM
jgi:hypothetical protein